MPAIISDHQVFTPHDMAEALQFMDDHRDEDWRPVAGGTDVMRRIYGSYPDTKRWINLAPLRAQLADVDDDRGRIRIGSLTTMTELRRSVRLHDACPLIQQAAASTGGVQRQNRTTVGGRIASNSLACETLPVWLALDAEIELTSRATSRRVSYRRFLTSDDSRAVAANELITAVLFTPPKHRIQQLLFHKVASRAAGAIGKLVLAAIAGLDADGRYRNVRLAFGGIQTSPVRAHETERWVEGYRPSESVSEQASNMLLTVDLEPIDDNRSTVDYRQRAARNLTCAFLARRIGETTSPQDNE